MGKRGPDGRAAWKKNQRDRWADGEALAMERAGNLFDLEDTVAKIPDVDLVGWMQAAPASVKGRNHVCRTCQPNNPGFPWKPVYRVQLAATERCTRCHGVLEAVHVPAQSVPDSNRNEK